jgi:hypothetical protein
MALLNRYFHPAPLDLRLTGKRFHIYMNENGIQKLLQNFEGDPTVGSKVMALSKRYSSLARPDLQKTPFGNSCKTLRAIQQSDQKLRSFRTVTLIWPDQTSASQSSDSTSSTRNTTSRNPCKNFRAIQWLNQKLWLFRTVTLIPCDKTSSSPSKDSKSTRTQTTSRNSCKTFRAI